MPTRPLGSVATATAVFLIGAFIGLAGDACHVTAGITQYEWTALPVLWESRAWFPLAVGAAVLGAAWAGRLAGLPATRERTRADVVTGAAAVLALYALTAVVADLPETVSVVLTGAIAVAIWSWWDPSQGAFGIAVAAAVLGPLAEVIVVELDVAEYTAGHDGLLGVAPWLPCLYFAAGAVASGIWAPIAGGDQPAVR